MGIFDWIKLLLGCTFVICGLVIFFTEIFGVFHFHYVLNRMHATAMGDTLGIASCMIGLMIFSGLNMTSLKLLLIVIFLWFASPVSSHVLARLEVATNENLESYCQVYTDLETLEAEMTDTTEEIETKQSKNTAASETEQTENAAISGTAQSDIAVSEAAQTVETGGETS